MSRRGGAPIVWQPQPGRAGAAPTEPPAAPAVQLSPVLPSPALPGPTTPAKPAPMVWQGPPGFGLEASSTDPRLPPGFGLTISITMPRGPSKASPRAVTSPAICKRLRKRKRQAAAPPQGREQQAEAQAATEPAAAEAAAKRRRKRKRRVQAAPELEREEEPEPAVQPDVPPTKRARREAAAVAAAAAAAEHARLHAAALSAARRVLPPGLDLAAAAAGRCSPPRQVAAAPFPRFDLGGGLEAALVDRPEQLAPALCALRRTLRHGVSALDLEWPQSRRRAALVQLASGSLCVLVRTCLLGFPPALRDFLGCARGCMARSAGYPKPGLAGTAEALLGLQVPKCKKVSTSNWAQAALTPQQLRYAALDALLSFHIYVVLAAAGVPSCGPARSGGAADWDAA
ncbi:hypothetical protein ABPG75_010816 [Micractinium tetrahymenae]